MYNIVYEEYFAMKLIETGEKRRRTRLERRENWYVPRDERVEFGRGINKVSVGYIA